MLLPYAGTDLAIYPVSRRVNNPKNDEEDLIRPLQR
jgi:putative SOS response-associated peptidase YedK